MNIEKLIYWVNEFFKYLEIGKNYSLRTIKNYRIDIREYVEFLRSRYSDSSSSSWDKLSISAAKLFLVFLYNKRYSRRTIARKLACLRSFYNFLLSRNVVRFNLFSSIPNPKQDKKLPLFLTEEQVDRLLSLDFENNFSGKRDRAIMEVLYSTGARVSELVGIDLDDISWDSAIVRLFGKGRKERIALLGRPALFAVKQYLPFRQNKIVEGERALFINKFGRRLSPRWVEEIVRNRLIQAGLWKKGLSVHSIRHSFATHMLNRGADLRVVQELLGHKNLITTQIYTHLTVDKMRQIYDIAHPHAN